MQFESFHLHSYHGFWAIIPCSSNMVTIIIIIIYITCVRVSFWAFYFYFSLVFYILGAFLIKHSFHSRLLDMRWLYQLGATPLVGYLPSRYPKRTRGIIVNYTFVGYGRLSFENRLSPHTRSITWNVRWLPLQPPLCRWRWRDQEHSGCGNLTGFLALSQTANRKLERRDHL